MSDGPRKLKINTRDASTFGLTDTELESFTRYFESEYGNGSIVGIEEIYLSPSVHWSDNALDIGKKKRPVGVAYKLRQDADLKKLIHSEDLYTAVSCYRVGSYGEMLDRMMSTSPHNALVKIEDHINKKMGEIFQVISDYIPSTSSNRLSGLYAHHIERPDAHFTYSDVSIGQKSCFVSFHMFETFTEVDGDIKVSYDLYLYVKSYDAASSKEVFDKVHKENLKPSDFIENNALRDLSYKANEMAIVNRGYIAHSIIEGVLKWKTEKISHTKEYKGRVISYITPQEELHCHMLNRTKSDNTIVYRDHCFDVNEMQETKHFTIFTGNGNSITRINMRGYEFKKEEWNSRLWSFPVEPPTTKLTLKELYEPVPSWTYQETYGKNEGPKTEQKLWSFGHGRIHVAAHPRYYRDPQNFAKKVKVTYGLEHLKGVTSKVYFCAIGQVYLKEEQDAFPIATRLIMLEDKQPYTIDRDDPEFINTWALYQRTPRDMPAGEFYIGQNLDTCSMAFNADLVKKYMRLFD